MLENALVFGQKKKIEVYLTYRHHSLCLQVKDFGEGIPAQFLPDQLFQLFFRGSETSTGNGLGLYVVKKALESSAVRFRLNLWPNQPLSWRPLYRAIFRPFPVPLPPPVAGCSFKMGVPSEGPGNFSEYLNGIICEFFALL
ncbi:MAG: HAMP domain-containing histidine kinase [Microscillaceae bacterium]|nr:HAMP domain-containing histidine kinase [Microscillaceae bacterium]